MVRAINDALLTAANKYIDEAPDVVGAPTGTASVDFPLWSTSDLTGLRINTAASGDTTLVEAVVGQTTRVHRLKISVAQPVVVQIKNGSTVLDVFHFVGNGRSAILDFSSRPWYVTTANTALVINLSGSVQVDGRVEYITGV